MSKSLRYLRGISGIALLGSAGAHYYTHKRRPADDHSLGPSQKHNTSGSSKMTVDQKFEVRHCLAPTLQPNLDAVCTPSNGGLLSHQEALLRGH